ncbi:MAG: PAS domain S-box protein [bacterium]
MSKNKELMKEFIKSFKDNFTYDPRSNLSARWALLWCTVLLLLGTIHSIPQFQMIIDFAFGIAAAALYPTLGATGTIYRDREKIITDYNKNLEKLIESKTEQLVKNEKKYRTLFEIVPAGMFRVTEGLEIADINTFALNLLGLTHNEVIGRRCLDLICMGEGTCKLCCSCGEIATRETTLHTPEGAQNHVVISCRNWEMEGKASIIGSITNINERKKLEETNLENKRKLESIFDGMDDGIIVVDHGKKIAAINRKQATTLGYAPEDLIGRPYSEIASPFRRETVENVFTTGKKNRKENSFPKGNNENIFMDIIYAPIKNKEGQVEQVIEVLRDITEMRNLEEQIRHAELLATIGELATCVAHEINNPIGIILINTQVLLEKITETNMNYKALKICEEECIRCRKIIRNFMDFARPDIPRKSLLNREKMEEIIGSCFKFLEFQIDKQGIQVRLNVDPESRIDIDPHQFKQVLLNIFLNAIQAMPKGGELRISVSIQTHHPQHPDGLTRLVIEDTGGGILPEDFPLIFKPFFTTKKGGKDGKGEKGTGLGLPITKRIIEANEGTIYVESEVGQGTRVILEVPLPQENNYEEDSRC